MSSSRLQITLTGPLLPGRAPDLGDVDRFDHVVRSRHRAPAETAAGHHRVQGDLLRLQAGGGAMAPWSTVWNCEPAHTVQLSAFRSTVQLSGSIGACAR
jgi:hypothetical protein